MSDSSIQITGGADPRPAAARLDDPARHAQYDPGGMHAAIGSLSEQLREAPGLADQVNWTAFKPTTPAGVCLCGMGGSAIGGDLARAYWEHESPVPFLIVRNDHLPEFINRFWLVIASSYSGNTEETLSATDEARRRGCRILAIATGGGVEQMASQYGWPMIKLPGGFSPRAALGYSFGPVMLALARWGIVPDRTDLLKMSADFLEQRSQFYDQKRPLTDNAAKQVAAVLEGHHTCVYGSSGSTDVLAYRFKGQLCENAKVPAFANVLPELNHNELVGMDGYTGGGQLALAVMRSADDTPRAGIRLDWIVQRLSARGIPVVSLTASGANRLVRMLSLVQLGDYISYHLAIVRGCDPTPVAVINDLKSQLDSTR
ncbi:MAG: bifunctional phosphoglucose/phosphomannose isomerase [Candidatus Zixiibacteriota bacterium]